MSGETWVEYAIRGSRHGLLADWGGLDAAQSAYYDWRRDCSDEQWEFLCRPVTAGAWQPADPRTGVVFL